MNYTLLDLSGKIELFWINFYELINQVATSNDIRFFVVGATARDLILNSGYGVPIKRATGDVDIAFRVSSWDEVEKLRMALIGTGQFSEGRDAKGLRYRGQLPVDIIPFGPIESPEGQISWPPRHDVVMSVLGFDEAYRAAQPVRLRADPELIVLFATPAGLALMKIAAWVDRHTANAKDAIDLRYIMESYLDAGNLDRFLNNHGDLLAGDDFNYERAGARLLGRDMAKIMSPTTRERILAILEAETNDQGKYQLVQHMMISSRLDDDQNQSFDKCLALLQDLKQGIRES